MKKVENRKGKKKKILSTKSERVKAKLKTEYRECDRVIFDLCNELQ